MDFLFFCIDHQCVDLVTDDDLKKAPFENTAIFKNSVIYLTNNLFGKEFCKIGCAYIFEVRDPIFGGSSIACPR